MASQSSDSIGLAGLLSTSETLDHRVYFGAWLIVDSTNNPVISIPRAGSSLSSDVAHGLVGRARPLSWLGSEDTGCGHSLGKAGGRAVVLNGRLPPPGLDGRRWWVRLLRFRGVTTPLSGETEGEETRRVDGFTQACSPRQCCPQKLHACCPSHGTNSV